MIVGIGTDIVEVSRIAQSLASYGEKFEQRIFTKRERKDAESKRDKASHYAKRFAAKEAVSKALGTGFNNGVSWQDIEVYSQESGKPAITLYGTAKELVAGNAVIHLSLSDDGGMAIAFATIELP